MHRGSVGFIVTAAAIAAACGGNTTASNRNALGTTRSEPAAPTGDADIAAPLPDRPDAELLWRVPSTSSVQYDCLNGNFGQSSPELFAELDYQIQACAGSGSDCADFWVIRADCSLSLQVRNQSHTASASPSDCAALARWATSELIAHAFDDPTACTPGGGNPPEMTEITLTSGPGPRKKTGLCPTEPYVSHRACMASVRSKYFPGL